MYFMFGQILLLLVVLLSVDGRRRTKPTTTTLIPITTSLYRQQALSETNLRRVVHCASPLSYNVDITKIAQTYAQHLCDTATFAHSGNTYTGLSLGENLWSMGASYALDLNTGNGSTPIDAWYGEISSYNFASPGFASNTGHFTQLVWKASTDLGLGYCCTTDKLKCYVVANYFPAGNVQGGYPINVRQSGSCP